MPKPITRSTGGPSDPALKYAIRGRPGVRRTSIAVSRGGRPLSATDRLHHSQEVPAEDLADRHVGKTPIEHALHQARERRGRAEVARRDDGSVVVRAERHMVL